MVLFSPQSWIYVCRVDSEVSLVAATESKVENLWRKGEFSIAIRRLLDWICGSLCFKLSRGNIVANVLYDVNFNHFYLNLWKKKKKSLASRRNALKCSILYDVNFGNFTWIFKKSIFFVFNGFKEERTNINHKKCRSAGGFVLFFNCKLGGELHTNPANFQNSATLTTGVVH